MASVWPSCGSASRHRRVSFLIGDTSRSAIWSRANCPAGPRVRRSSTGPVRVSFFPGRLGSGAISSSPAAAPAPGASPSRRGGEDLARPRRSVARPRRHRCAPAVEAEDHAPRRDAARVAARPPKSRCSKSAGRLPSRALHVRKGRIKLGRHSGSITGHLRPFRRQRGDRCHLGLRLLRVQGCDDTLSRRDGVPPA